MTTGDIQYTPAHTHFLAHIQLLQEPHSFKEANQVAEWRTAMQAEIAALEANHTWDLVSLPKGHKAIGCRWVFKIKHKANGEVDKFKARLVAKGYNQLEGIDYMDSFSPVAKTVTVRLVLAITSAYSWHLHQLDINNAFLHGYLEETVYMQIPEGYDKGDTGQVCKLNRSLYGLKQASRQWNLEFTEQITKYGFTQSTNDYCLFISFKNNIYTVLLLYVDDILLAGNSESEITKVKAFLHSKFTIKDLGKAKFFLGIEIARGSTGMYITQRKYIKDIILDLNLVDAREVATPLSSDWIANDENSGPYEDPSSYRRLIGRLLYLNFTRPDITYSVNTLSQYMQSPTLNHWKGAINIVKYLKGHLSQGLFYPTDNILSLSAYCDADWGRCTLTRRSITGYCVLLGTALIAWKSKKQSTVARSTAEAEYRSAGSTVCELKWISYLCTDLTIPIELPIALWCDNQSAIQIIENPVFHERTKHIEMDCHYVRLLYKKGFVKPYHINSKLQLADAFTKTLPAPLHQQLLSKMNFVPHHSS